MCEGLAGLDGHKVFAAIHNLGNDVPGAEVYVLQLRGKAQVNHLRGRYKKRIRGLCKADSGAYPPKSEIKAVSEIRSDYLINYLQKRKIPLELARQYCKEVIVRNPQKGMNFTLLGFPNNMGGYALNAPTGFKSTTKAAVTTINTEGKMSVTPSSKSVAVFEGFFDFLSWQMMQGSKTPSCDIVVLNSVNNLQKATAFIGAHEKITGFLDNDEAGQKCQTALERLFPGKVTDMSDLYGKYKDLNEMLQNSRGYTAEMKLTPHA